MPSRRAVVEGYLGVVHDAIRHQRIDLEFTLRDHLEQSIGTFEVGRPAEETCSGSGWLLGPKFEVFVLRRGIGVQVTLGRG